MKKVTESYKSSKKEPKKSQRGRDRLNVEAWLVKWDKELMAAKRDWRHFLNRFELRERKREVKDNEE